MTRPYAHLGKLPRRVKRYLWNYWASPMSERHCGLVRRWLRKHVPQLGTPS